MKRITCLALAAAVSLAWSNGLLAEGKQVYTWKDENGVVHFTDSPPDNPNAVTLDVPEVYRPGTAGAYPEATPTDTSSEAETPPGEEAPVSYADEKREAMKKKRTERREAQTEKRAGCMRAQQAVAALEPHRRVFFTNEQGETERMDDVERVRKVEEAKKAVADNCE